jgi:type II secretion system protein C
MEMELFLIQIESVISMRPEIERQNRICKKFRRVLVFVVFFFISTLSSVSSGSQIGPAEKKSSQALSFLVLNGIIVSEAEFSSVALLKDSQNGEDLILKIGETVGDYELVRILKNRVVFKRESQTFQIYMGQPGNFGTRQKEAPEVFKKNAGQVKNNREQPLEQEVVTKEFTRSYLEKKILAEWKLILDQTEFFPLLLDGQTRGYKMTKLPEASLLSELGIQKNDVILELNGQELKDKAFIISLIERFKNNDRGELTIERNGRKIRYVFVLKK